MARARSADIEIEEDEGFQRRSWRVQRVSRLLLFALLLAAVAGLFGGGGVSAGRAVAAEGKFAVEFPRFARNHADITLVVQVAAENVRDGQILIAVDRAWLRAWEFKSAAPLPDGTHVAGDQVVFGFRVDSQGEPAELRLHWRTTQAGAHRGAVGIVGGPAVQLRQFIFP